MVDKIRYGLLGLCIIAVGCLAVVFIWLCNWLEKPEEIYRSKQGDHILSPQHDQDRDRQHSEVRPGEPKRDDFDRDVETTHTRG